ncbi:MAG: DUF4097 family beta strand repeat protein [Lachnospiraceae bacterium]|nr:DUF4097 family beta strand repeat protein [Lachnospiraceae bacterium]
METIKVYLDNMFMNLPQEAKVLRAKEELLNMMTEKYEELRAEGKNDNEALGTVIMEFGSMEELAEALGVTPIRHQTASEDKGVVVSQDTSAEDAEPSDAELDALEQEFRELEEDVSTIGTEMAGLAGEIGKAVRGAISSFMDGSGENAGTKRTRGTASFETDSSAKEERKWAEVRPLDAFHSIELQAKIADVIIEAGEGYSLSLTEKLEPEVSVTDGVLRLREETEHAWFSRGGVGSVFFGFGKAGRIRITVPSDVALQNCDLHVRAGNVSLQGVDAQDWKVIASAGNLKAAGINAKSFQVRCSAGNIRAERLKAEQLVLDSSAGNLRLEDVTGNETKLRSSAGNVKCAASSLGELQAQSSAGNVKLEDTSATAYRLKSSVGNIKLVLPGGESEYSYDLKSTHGDVRVGDEKHGKSYRTEDAEGKIPVEAVSSIGSVRVEFA